jgi:hypothetical protein
MKPLEGCAIYVGKAVTYSNMRGEWSSRVKKNRPMEIVVAINEFSVPGDFEIVEAPARATAAEPVKIVVRRVPK